MGYYIDLADTTGSGDQVVTTMLPAQGALMLLDAADLDAGALTAGTWTNRARVQAAAASGLTLGQCDAVYQSQNLASARGKVELTSKHGLHLIASQTNPDKWAWTLRPQLPLTQWVNASGHTIFVSLWLRVTRPQPAFSGALSAMVYGSGGATPWRYQVRSDMNIGHAASTRVPSSWVAPLAPGTPVRTALSVNLASTPDVASQVWMWKLFAAGNETGIFAQPYPLTTAPPSTALYRVYVEDLTVSGRSFAEVAALDAIFYEDAFKPGGRFAGDTYTAPSTIP